MADVTSVSLLDLPIVRASRRVRPIGRHRYGLFDAEDRPVGRVEQVEQRGVLSRLLGVAVVLRVTLQVSGAGQPVLRLVKPAFGGRVAVYDAEGRQLGSVRGHPRFGKARFILADGRGVDVGAVAGERWRAKTFAIRDSRGEQIGWVAKRRGEHARTLGIGAEQYVLHRVFPLDEPLRGLSLAAPLAIDLIVRQKDAGAASTAAG